MNSELQNEIKAKGLFATTCRLQKERRAAMPQSVSGLYDRNLTAGSKRAAGSHVTERNQVERIRNSDPDIFRGSPFIGKSLAVATADADLDDEPEVEQSTDDMPVELSLIQSAVIAGDETPSDIEPEQSDEEGEEESTDSDGIA